MLLVRGCQDLRGTSKSGLKRTKKSTIIGSEANFFCVVFCAFAVCSSGVVVVAAGLVFELCCACLWGGLSNDH